MAYNGIKYSHCGALLFSLFAIQMKRLEDAELMTAKLHTEEVVIHAIVQLWVRHRCESGKADRDYHAVLCKLWRAQWQSK